MWGSGKKVDISGVLATGRPLALDAHVRVPSFGSYTFAEPARLAVEICRIDHDLGLSGSICATASGVCDRCLRDVHTAIDVEVDECIPVGSQSEADFAESNVLEGTFLDVADLARQLIDSALPMLLLCSDDCPGLCPSCGSVLRDGPCACSVSVKR